MSSVLDLVSKKSFMDYSIYCSGLRISVFQENLSGLVKAGQDIPKRRKRLRLVK